MTQNDNQSETGLFEDPLLDQELSRMPRVSISSDFVEATTRRFDRAINARYRRHLIGFTAAVLLTSSAAIWLLLMNFSSVVIFCASFLGKTKAFLSALTTVWGHEPALGITLIFSALIMVLVCAGILLALGRNFSVVTNGDATVTF